MSIEPLMEKLATSVKTAQAALRQQFLTKIKAMTSGRGAGNVNDLQYELEQLVDDILAEISATYDDLITTIEEELPAVVSSRPKLVKPRSKPKPAPVLDDETPPEPAFVKPTHVHKAFKEEGLRVSAEAKPKLMALLNDAIKRDIDRIKQQLPTYEKGEKEGEKKRITIKPEDVKPGVLDQAQAVFLPASNDDEQVLDNFLVNEDEVPCNVAIVARMNKKEEK